MRVSPAPVAYSSTTNGRARSNAALNSGLRGKRAAVLLFSYYPSDPRPRRAAEALVTEGLHVEVLCLRRSKDEPARETFNGVEILRLPLKRRRGGPLTYLVQYFAFILTTFFLLALRSLSRRFALVHVHNMPDLLVFSALVPKAFGAKVILDIHDPMPELMMSIFRLEPSCLAVRLLRRFERWSIAFADHVLTVNLACKEIFAARSCPSAKILVVMNSPDETTFDLRSAVSPSMPRPTPFVIMYHGSIVERNGLDLAINALETVRCSVPDAELRIYGQSTPFLDEVMRAVRRSGLQNAVRYFGEKGLNEIVAAIDDCDLGIIPNRRTIFTEINTPTRIFEYLSRGKPVITGRTLGVRHYFPDDALFFFDLGDANDLARGIVHVFNHPQDIEKIVRRGQEIYLAHRWNEEREAFIRRTAILLGASKQ